MPIPKWRWGTFILGSGSILVLMDQWTSLTTTHTVSCLLRLRKRVYTTQSKRSGQAALTSHWTGTRVQRMTWQHSSTTSWMNVICCWHHLFCHPIDGQWNIHSTVALLGHYVKGKPDLVLLDDVKVADWRCVCSIGEMKSSPLNVMYWTICSHNSLVSCVVITSTWGLTKPYLAGKTSIIFAMQDNCEYVLSVGFLKDLMDIHKMDRSGCITSLTIGINDYPDSQWKLFLYIILSLSMILQYYPLHTDLSDLSLLALQNFTILSTIFIDDGLIGRGTCIFASKMLKGINS